MKEPALLAEKLFRETSFETFSCCYLVSLCSSASSPASSLFSAHSLPPVCISHLLRPLYWQCVGGMPASAYRACQNPDYFSFSYQLLRDSPLFTPLCKAVHNLSLKYRVLVVLG